MNFVRRPALLYGEEAVLAVFAALFFVGCGINESKLWNDSSGGGR